MGSDPSNGMIGEFTLVHPVLGSLRINEPGGWPTTKMRLQRHVHFKSLVEFFGEGTDDDTEDSNAGDFTFYGDNGVINGGIEFILEAIRLYGPDTDVNIFIRLSPDGYTFFNAFSGQLALWAKKHLPDNKIQIPIIRNNFWTKFTNRLDQPVNVQSETNQDGEAANILQDNNITLTPQILDERSETIQKRIINLANTYPVWDPITYSPTLNTDIPNDGILQLSLDDVILNEIAENFSIPIALLGTGERAAAMFGFEYGGIYDFDIKISMTTLAFKTDTDVFPFPLSPVIPSDGDILYYPTSGNAPGAGFDYKIYIQFDNDLPIELTRTDQNISFLLPLLLTNQTNYWTEYTYTGSRSFEAGGTVRMWVQNGPSPNQTAYYLYNTFRFEVVNPHILGNENNLRMQEIMDFYYPGPLVPGATKQLWKDFNFPEPGVESYINILGHTVHTSSTSDAFLLHDVAGQVTDRIIGEDDTFYSEYLGSGNTLYRQYEVDGCGWRYMLIKGLQLRQYTLTEKPFFQSFRQWWNGINPILNLGLGYETVNGVEVIRVEQVGYFYDQSQVSLNISNVREISSSYDESLTLKTVRNGYKVWQSENISGIDDWAKQTRASRLQKAGKEMVDESEFIAAPLAIETTRRTTRKKSADYKFDDNTFIIAVNPVEISPMNYEPELDENFSFITNLLNSNTRYNSVITPARNFFRRLSLYSIGLQDYLSSVFKFTGGEGNYDMVSDYDVSDGCNQETSVVSEKMDIPVSGTPLHRNEVFEMIVPMEWEDYLSIRDNRNYPIGVSQTDTGHIKMFIKDLTFEPFKSRATINAWTVEPFEIQVIQTEILGKVCDAVVKECEDAYLTEDSFELITEDGDCLVLE